MSRSDQDSKVLCARSTGFSPNVTLHASECRYCLFPVLSSAMKLQTV